MTDIFAQNYAENKYCKSCDFKCAKNSDWNRHILTRKHRNADKILTNVDTTNAESIKNAPITKMLVCSCGKKYKHRQSLFVHKKKCKQFSDSESDNDSEYEPTSEKTTNDNNDNNGNNDNNLIKYLLKENADFKTLIMELVKKEFINNSINNNTTNNVNSHNNNSFCLNVFLNDTCKGAMNMSDFVDSIKVQLTDLENFAEVGYANGVSNIFVKGLNALGVHLRPIHCSDLKRETLYIKDNDCWVKEQDDCDRLKTAIKKVAFKNIRQINEWIKENPGCTDPRTKKHDKYNKIVMNSMSGTTIQEQQENIDKIVKNVTKAVTIDKASFKTLKH